MGPGCPLSRPHIWLKTCPGFGTLFNMARAYCVSFEGQLGLFPSFVFAVFAVESSEFRSGANVAQVCFGVHQLKPSTNKAT